MKSASVTFLPSGALKARSRAGRGFASTASAAISPFASGASFAAVAFDAAEHSASTLPGASGFPYSPRGDGDERERRENRQSSAQHRFLHAHSVIQGL